MAKYFVEALEIGPTTTSNDIARALVCQRVEGQERINTDVEAVNHVLNSCVKDDATTMETLKVQTLKTYSGQTVVPSQKVLGNRALRCGCALSEQQTNYIFVVGLFLRVQDIMRFC